MEKEMDSESCSIGKQEFTRVNGKEIHDLAEGWSDIPMETDMKENFRMVNLMEKAFILGPMVKCMKASGVLD